MKTSEAFGEITKALIQFQADVPPLKRNRTGDTGKRKYKYIDLDEVIDTCRPTLIQNGLGFIQSVVSDGDRIGVRTRLLHVSGEYIETDPFFLPLGKETARDAGGAITYAKRYALMAVLGVTAEEDDDAAGSRPSDNQSRQQYPDRRESYQQAPPANQHQQSRQQDRRPANQQQPTNISEISPNQLKAIKATINKIATANGSDTVEIYNYAARAIGAEGKTSSQLSRQEASHMIDYLRSRQPAAN